MKGTKNAGVGVEGELRKVSDEVEGFGSGKEQTNEMGAFGYLWSCTTTTKVSRFRL